MKRQADDFACQAFGGGIRLAAKLRGIGRLLMKGKRIVDCCWDADCLHALLNVAPAPLYAHRVLTVHAGTVRLDAQGQDARRQLLQEALVSLAILDAPRDLPFEAFELRQS